LAGVAVTAWISLLRLSTPKCPFHPKVPLLALLGLMHLGIARLLGILGRRWRSDEWSHRKAVTLDAVYKLVRLYSALLGFEIGPHALRATAATMRSTITVGLFDQGNRIGTRNQWEQILAGKGLALRGHRLIRRW
jgi:hypothetical protein